MNVKVRFQNRYNTTSTVIPELLKSGKRSIVANMCISYF